MLSILVLLSGTVFLLVLLPFTFIEFFYEPWISAQAEAPRRVRARVGIHTGEAVRSQAGAAGAAVEVARAIAPVGRAGEVTVSRVVADVLPGSGFAFEPRGGRRP
jgi:class 3 adenylate cyclase